MDELLFELIEVLLVEVLVVLTFLIVELFEFFRDLGGSLLLIFF